MTTVSPMELMPPVEELMKRYSELRDYVGITPEDIDRCVQVWCRVEKHSDDLIEDFYNEILRHPGSARVIREGGAQVDRLKVSLAKWLEDLFGGVYDTKFLTNRWIIGWRHVQIGLPQMWTAAAMSRLKQRLFDHLSREWEGTLLEFQTTASAIGRLIDLDLTMIQDAYHAESVADYLKTEKNLNDGIISTTQSIVLIVDPSQGHKIVRGNRYLAKLVSQSEELGDSIRSLLDLMPETDLAVLDVLLRQDCSDEPCGPVVTQLLSDEPRERRIRWFTRTIPRLTDYFPEVGGNLVMLVGHDISDLVDAQRKAVQQERLAAIGQTMAGLAHESRNAFQRSQAALETLALDLDDRPGCVELIERIQRANDHLLHLYEEVLQFAKPVRLDIKVVHLSSLAKVTYQHIVQAGNENGHRLVLQGGEAVPTVLADPFAVEQILRNLFENAAVVSVDKKPICVSLSKIWKGDHPGVRIDVRDYGPGIAPQYRERLFEPFFSTRPRGTGLGLPIARRLAEAHGGSLELLPADDGDGAIARLELLEVAAEHHMDDPQNQPDTRRTAVPGD